MRLDAFTSAAKAADVSLAFAELIKSCPSRSVEASERTRSSAAPRMSVVSRFIISSAMAKIPGLLGTTRRLWSESHRNQRDHCSRRGSGGRLKPCRARESETRRVMASIWAPQIIGAYRLRTAGAKKPHHRRTLGGAKAPLFLFHTCFHSGVLPGGGTGK